MLLLYLCYEHVLKFPGVASWVEKAKMLYVLLNKFTPILNTYYDIDLGTFLGLKSF